MNDISPTKKVYKLVIKTIKDTEEQVAKTKSVIKNENLDIRKFLKMELQNLHDIRRNIENLNNSKID